MEPTRYLNSDWSLCPKIQDFLLADKRSWEDNLQWSTKSEREGLGTCRRMRFRNGKQPDLKARPGRKRDAEVFVGKARRMRPLRKRGCMAAAGKVILRRRRDRLDSIARSPPDDGLR